MRRALALFGILVAACGDGSGPSEQLPDYFVNEVTGNDGNPGTTMAAPFRTITKALSVADSGEMIKVAPGLYDEANGEVFPLTVPAGVILIGDEMNKGGGSAPTSIVGGDTVAPLFVGNPLRHSAALEMGAFSTIAGFTITDSASVANRLGVLVRQNRVTIRNNRIVDNTLIGIYAVLESIDHVIAGNVITGGQIGIGLVGGGLGSRIEGNVVTVNSYGMDFDRVPDLGGGAKSSAGGNTFSCNTTNDLWTNTGATISARNNFWDHVPPTQDAGAAGVDIVNDGNALGAATFVTTGAALAASPCP